VSYKKRVDLVLLVQDVLNAKRKTGTYLTKSLVSWVIKDPEIQNEDILLAGKSEETEEINFEQA